MPHSDIIAPVTPAYDLPGVRTVTLSDLKVVLRKGLDDFRAMPTHAVFLCLIYPVIGLLLARVAFGYDIIPLLYPLAAGFTLLGPIAAIGLYELSRRRELGLETSWLHVFDVFRSPSFPSIAALGLLLLAIFTIWIAIANALYISDFGYGHPESLTAFIRDLFTTPQGLHLVVVGNAVGLAFAVLTLLITVVSFPLLLDRNVGVPAAMLTSLQLVYRNPVTMMAWGIIVAAGLLLGFLTLLLGLAVIIPVLGHATWHLYRAGVEPDEGPRPEIDTRKKGEHFEAQFPASLFVRSTPRNED